jgi:hypothetical protein
MDQSNNIVAAVNSIWETAGLSLDSGSLVPGGLQWGDGRMKPPAASPYAQIWVRLDGKPQWDSGLSYVQAYGIQITVWCGDNNEVLLAVDAALDALLGFATKLETTGFLTQGASTIQIETVPGGLDQEDIPDNQHQIGIVQRAWRATLNEVRQGA